MRCVHVIPGRWIRKGAPNIFPMWYIMWWKACSIWLLCLWPLDQSFGKMPGFSDLPLRTLVYRKKHLRWELLSMYEFDREDKVFLRFMLGIYRRETVRAIPVRDYAEVWLHEFFLLKLPGPNNNRYIAGSWWCGISLSQMFPERWFFTTGKISNPKQKDTKLEIRTLAWWVASVSS